MIKINEKIQIDPAEIEEKFIRSPGSGGQNVNKVATSVQLRFNAKESPAVSPDIFLRLKKLAGRRMTQEGILLISAHKHRTQERNRKEAIIRLTKLLTQAATPPKKRHATKPTKASKKQRLESKGKRSDLKQMRRKIQFDR